MVGKNSGHANSINKLNQLSHFIYPVKRKKMKQGEEINIIIAEDNKYFIEGLKVVLESELDYNVIDICENGKELVESPFLHYAQLIISDIEMPVMNGIDAAEKIKEKHPGLPMLALTMHHNKVILDKLVLAGFKGYVYKPDVPELLSEAIAQVLQNKFVFPVGVNTP